MAKCTSVSYTTHHSLAVQLLLPLNTVHYGYTLDCRVMCVRAWAGVCVRVRSVQRAAVCDCMLIKFVSVESPNYYLIQLYLIGCPS
jgi:hypothetical protein